MSHFLLQQQPEIGQTDILDGVRMVYTLKNKNLELSFRQDVGNIKVGSIVLSKINLSDVCRSRWVRLSFQKTMSLSSTRLSGRRHQPWRTPKRCSRWST